MNSWVAQLAERVAVNHLVGGSNPFPGANDNSQQSHLLIKYFNRADCDKKLLFFKSHREKGMEGIIEFQE